MAHELSLKDAISFLNSQIICVVATVTPAGHPQAATVFYWIDDIKDDSFAIYFVTKQQTRKFKNLTNNPRLSIVVGTQFEPNTVQMDGEAVLVDTNTSLRKLQNFPQMMANHAIQSMIYGGAFYPKSPFKGLEGEAYALFRMIPQQLSMMGYNETKDEVVVRQIL